MFNQEQRGLKCIMIYFKTPYFIPFGCRSDIGRQESIPKNVRTVAVSLDGVMVGMKPQKSVTEKPASMKAEWKEVSCGTINFFDADGERLSTIETRRLFL